MPIASCLIQGPGGFGPVCNILMILHQGCAGRSIFLPGGAGQGKGKNLRVGAGWGGAKKRVNPLIQKFDKSAYLLLGDL